VDALQGDAADVWQRSASGTAGTGSTKISPEPSMCLGSVVPSIEAVDDWQRCFPGFRLIHTVHLVFDLNPDAISTATSILERENAAIVERVARRFSDVLEQKIVLVEMTERQAIVICEQLAALNGVLRARTEHCLVRDSSKPKKGND
jgi:dihydroorotase